MVAQKLKILLEKGKWTIRGSALVTLSDTKQGFTEPRGKQKCVENGLCNICKFFYVFIVFVFTTNLYFQLDMVSPIAFILPGWNNQNFWTMNTQNYLLSICSNHFPTNAKISSFSLAQKSLSGFFANA